MLGRHCCRWTSLALGVFTVWAGLAADAVGQGNAATDRAALEAVYRATGGDDWTTNTNWLSDAPLEDWSGVEVTDGRVTGLRLGGRDESARRHVGNGLTGSLPAELGTLSQLRWVEIGGNSGLTGRIPAELGNLARLESLDLRWNWLTGSIPAALGLLTELEFLTLDGNALTGSIPAELSNLIDLRNLALGFNLLSGKVPPELGNLTGLVNLYLKNNMLSGPLPSSMSRLSALDQLRLDGSGLCVPDSPAMQAWVAAIGDFTGVFCEGSVSFSRVVTQLDLDRIDSVFAVVDLNGDGREDVLGGKHLEYNTAAPERLSKVPLHVFVGEENGGFRHAPELVEGTIDVRRPIVVADDFNGDGRADLAVFDAGVYVVEQSVGAGNPPQLFLSSPDGRLRPSQALADAVRREHERNPQGPPKGISGPADLHLKSATSGDIDGDGDIDLWVDSIGGANVSSHFMVNNGDGTFTVDEARAPPALRYNWPEYWYHLEGHLVDVDNDGDNDLVLGQNRREATVSIVLVNDGTGHYPTRVELPRPAFNEGYTTVSGQTDFDVDVDGFRDLLMVHRRNDALPNVLPGTGRYVQVLVNRGGTSFGDGTRARIGDQRATTPELSPDGDPLDNAVEPRMHDVDLDGCADLVMWRNVNVRTESPLVYRNNGRGRFQAMSPVPFLGSSRHFGFGAVPADVNGDGAIDFVVPNHNNGPDREYSTADDFAMFVTLLNTTPPGPIRCADPANRPPAPTGTLPNRALAPDGTLTVDVSRAFADPDGDALTYTVSSSAPRVVSASAAGAVVTLTAVGEGRAMIRVTATDPGRLSAVQSFTVTVSTTVSGSFTDDPLQPGVTPVKAVHFTELRSRIDALRTGTGLGRFAWTDPVLRAGVTPVRRVHLLELRQALAQAYATAGRAAPRWTDASPAAGSTPIRAAHLTELRVAVLALE